MQDTVSILLLCVPPIVLTGLIGGTLYWARGFRGSFGAHRPLTGGAILVATLFLIIHSGYYAAPFLLGADRVVLALWLVVPVATAATLALLWLFLLSSASVSPGASEPFRKRSLIGGGLLATYLLPAVVLYFNLRA